MFTAPAATLLGMDQSGTYRCEATAADGEGFVRFVSVHSIRSVVGQLRASCTVEGIDLLRVNVYRCDAKGNRIGEQLTTWEKPLR